MAETNFRKFIALCYYNIANDIYYIIYDIVENKFNKISAEALKHIPDQVINLEVEEDYISHLSKVYRLYGNRMGTSKSINFNLEKVNEFGEESYILHFNNVVYIESSDSFILNTDSFRDFNNQNIKSNYYISYQISLDTNIKSTTIKVRRLVGHLVNNTKFSFEPTEVWLYSYKQNIRSLNDSDDINNKIAKRNAKHNLISDTDSNICYCMHNGVAYLVDINTKAPEILVPKFIDRIGIGCALKLVNVINNKHNVSISKSQYDSLMYSLYTVEQYDDMKHLKEIYKENGW